MLALCSYYEDWTAFCSWKLGLDSFWQPKNLDPKRFWQRENSTENFPVRLDNFKNFISGLSNAPPTARIRVFHRNVSRACSTEMFHENDLASHMPTFSVHEK